MNFTIKKMDSVLIALSFLLFSFISFNANAVMLTPSTAGVIAANLGPSNCEPDCVYTTFNINGGVNDGSLSLLYKANQGGSDEGTFAGSYDTTFSNTPGDPEDALIEYLGGASITCPDCYLAIKDGNQNPSYYFFDLTSWNGVEDIDMDDFWVGPGAISHVSIWGVPGTPPTNIPEPGMLLLLAVGLAGLSLASRRNA